MMHNNPEIELRLMILKCSRAITAALLMQDGYQEKDAAAIAERLHFPDDTDGEPS